MEESTPEGGAGPTPAAKRGRGLWIGIAIVVVVVAILIAAVLGGFFNAPPTVDRVLKIGTVLSLTGTSGLEVFGPKNQRGVALAVKEINAAGGVLGSPILVVNEDDNGVDATAADRARKLITTDHVDAIIGAVGSGKCAAVLEVTKPNQVVQVSASCTSPIFSNLTYSEGWFFRTAPSDALQGIVAAVYAHNNRSFTNMAVIGNNNPYGRGLANVFADKFRALGGTAKVSIFDEGSSSYSSVLGTLLAPLPEAVYMAEYPTDGLNVMRDWAANPAWSGIKWIFSEGVLDQSGFVDKLVTAGINPQPFEGSAPGAYLGIVGPLYDNFLTRYKAEYANQDPGLFTANAYDAVYLLASAAQLAGTATGPSLRLYLRAVADAPGKVFTGGEWTQIRAAIAAHKAINYEGASGSVDLDDYGDPLSGYGIWGMNATNKIETRAFFGEGTVISLLGSPPAAVSSPDFAPAAATLTVWVASVSRVDRL